MKRMDPIMTLDSIEDWATRNLASWGWRLERKPFSGWPIPAGWQYCSLGIASRSGKPFRLEILTRWAKTQREPRQDEETAQECEKLLRIMQAIWMAREALDQSNSSASLSIGMWFNECLKMYDWQAVLAEGVSRWRREIAGKNRRVQLPKRAVMCAMDAGYQATSEVKNFLTNESRLTDGWGAFDIEAVNGAFILTDTDRNFAERTLQVTRIATLISEIKERYYD